MRVIYIAGASHSGSTLLDMMLNAHPEIVSVGEVMKLNQIKRDGSGKPKGTRCSCGVRGLLQCDFWSGVNKRIKETHGKSLADLNLNEHSRYDEHDPNSLLFEAVAQVSGKSLIVDSSKMPRRLRHLMGIPKLNVYPIYLIRDPRGQIASVIAQNGLLRSILHHEIVHAQIRKTLKRTPHSVVKYENLVLNPEVTLQNALESLGLEFDSRQLAWAEQVKHSFAGNHVRRQTKSELVLDERWKDELSITQKAIIGLGTVFSRHAHPPDERAGLD